MFTNTAADTIHFVKCGPEPGVALDRLESYPPSGAPPDFEVREIEGVYRLAIGGAVFHHDPHQPDFGMRVPVERPTSNRFVIGLAR